MGGKGSKCLTLMLCNCNCRNDRKEIVQGEERRETEETAVITERLKRP
jgi:hypothetical protein